MKSRLSMLSAILVAGVFFSTTSFAQDDKQKPQTPSNEAQSAATDQSQSQPTADAKPDQDQTPAVADQDQTQPASDQDDKDKKSDKKSKEKDAKAKHNGGKNDVDAIGNRMGKEYATQIEASLKLVSDPVINEYVNRVGQNLVRNSDAKVPFTIKVVDSDEINAFALPGGFFYVNTG